MILLSMWNYFMCGKSSSRAEPFLPSILEMTTVLRCGALQQSQPSRQIFVDKQGDGICLAHHVDPCSPSAKSSHAVACPCWGDSCWEMWGLRFLRWVSHDTVQYLTLSFLIWWRADETDENETQSRSCMGNDQREIVATTGLRRVGYKLG